MAALGFIVCICYLSQSVFSDIVSFFHMIKNLATTFIFPSPGFFAIVTIYLTPTFVTYTQYILISLLLGFQLEKAMTPHSSTLAWKIPWTEEPGRLQSMGSLRVGHNWATSLWLFTFMHWRRTWQPIPVFLPGESQGHRSLVGCRLWGRTESDTTEAT